MFKPSSSHIIIYKVALLPILIIALLSSTASYFVQTANANDLPTTPILTLGNSSDNTSSQNNNITEQETIIIASDELKLIQGGNYFDNTPTEKPVVMSTQSSSATMPTAAQTAQVKSRVNLALMNVEHSNYAGEDMWCVVDIRDLNVPTGSSSDALNYAKIISEQIINSNPDLFYMSTSYGYGRTKITLQNGTVSYYVSKIMIKYAFKPQNISAMKTKYETAISSVLSWVKDNSSDAEKTKAIHDWLVRNSSYHTSASNKGNPTAFGNYEPWSSYGALVSKKAVCEGYSLAFVALMNRLNIQASYVMNAGHGWNRVRLYDTDINGKNAGYYWFNLDITWDDPIPDGGFSETPSTTYFLKSDKYFKTHNVGSNKEHTTWTPSGTSATNTKYDNKWSGSVYKSAASNRNQTITFLSIVPSSITLQHDSTYQLKLAQTPSSASLTSIKWSSSNTKVVSVDQKGALITGTQSGTATISASIQNRKATCLVNVRNATSLSSARITLANPSADLTYKAGIARRPALKISVGSKTLSASTDYSVIWPSDTISPGVKTLTIVGKGDYAGTRTFSYTITCPLSKVSRLQPSDPNPTYNGSVQKKAPTLQIQVGSQTITLKEGTDYTISWPKDLTNAGTKSLTIRGKGIYTGSITYTYKIQPIKLSSATINGITNKRYTGKPITLPITMSINNKNIPASGYTITYKNNTKLGRATIVITGKGNYSGSKAATFQIVSTPTWTRLWGQSALDTMARITSYGWTTSGGTVLVATDSTYKDALSACGVAGLFNAPIILTNTKNLSAQAKNQLTRLKPSKIIVAGGPYAVSNNVLTQIKAVTKITPIRLYGQSATDTAAALNKAYKNSWKDQTAFLATSAGYWDALSAAPLAYAKHYPIFMVDTKTKISANTISAIKACNIKQVIIVGGTSVVSNDVVLTLKKNGINVLTRLWGKTAIDTSKAIANWGIKHGMSANNIGVSTSRNYPDALCGAALCGKNNAVLVLSHPDNTSAKNIVSSNKKTIASGYVFGGVNAISPKEYNAFIAAGK